MKNKIASSILISFIGLYGVDMPPMPPMIPSLDTKAPQQKSAKQTKQKSAMPKACELIPPMVIFLPPPMENQLIKCKNEMFKPKKEFVQKQLAKLLKKKITIEKIEFVAKFNQLYKITYNKNNTILTNKTVDAFIQQ